MPRNGSGQYIPLTNTWNPPVTGVLATGADFQAQLTDIAAAITQSFSKDGQTPMTGSLPMNNNSIIGVAAGTAAAPSISPTGDTNTGLYFPAADQVAISTGGVQRVVVSDTGVAVQSGTAASPSISPTGDTNTGLYFPAADQVAISTGGVQRVMVNSAGHVGIGTNTPGDAFTLSSGNARIQKEVPQLLFRSPGDVKKWFISANISDSVDSGLNFGKGDGIGPGTTYMRIDSAGSLNVNGRANFGNYGGGFQGITLVNNDDSSAAETVSFIDSSNNLNVGDSNIFFGHKVNGGSFLAFASTPPGDRNTDRRIERLRIDEYGAIRPSTDNAYTLGTASNRWSVVYAATGTINTSDERLKLDFADTLGLDFILNLEPVSYRYKKGKTVIDKVEDGVEEVPAVLDEDGNELTPATTKQKYKHVERILEGKRRYHGLKAQQVKQTLDQFGVDFAGWILTDPEDPGSEQGLRYDQFIAPLIKSIKEQQAIIESLTARIAALEAK